MYKLFRRIASNTPTYRSYTNASNDIESLTNKLIKGDRGALSRAITLVESKLPSHHTIARQLLSSVATHRHPNSLETIRIGISGPPGVGKSTFIEELGSHIISRGDKVAVLAVDPSSIITGGSILGDKTRMTELAGSDNAYVRPSPSSGFLGGVTANMFEVINLCEAAGYKYILIETVGVGQSETQISQLTDMVVLLLPPAGGDELQGIKKGIMEVSDLIVINKADGAMIQAAKKAQRQVEAALHLSSMRPTAWQPQVMCCTSLAQVPLHMLSNKNKENKTVIPRVPQVLDTIHDYFTKSIRSGDYNKKRSDQNKDWMWKQVNQELVTRLYLDTHVKQIISHLQSQVGTGQCSPRVAANSILDTFVHHNKSL